MQFLVIDNRFGTPIYAFLALDPREARAYPGLPVRLVTLTTLEALDGPENCQMVGRRSVGQDPNCADQFREFSGDRAVVRAGFVLIEPLYVGPSWEAYNREFLPHGGKAG